MPGGTGTLEEIAEVMSLLKLQLHDKPCIFYNVSGFYEPLRQMLQDMVSAGFLEEEDLRKIRFIEQPGELNQIINKQQQRG